jgi:lipoprotein signal peptidase
MYRVTLRIGLWVFATALAVDLLTKEWAIGHTPLIVYNTKPAELPRRVLMSVVAIGVAAGLAQLASRRGLGRQWGVVIGCGLLVAGIAGNGISAVLWSHGVPDFLDFGDRWAWNLADVEIGIGLTGGILSVAVSAVAAYAREKLAEGQPRP